MRIMCPVLMIHGSLIFRLLMSFTNSYCGLNGGQNHAILGMATAQSIE